MLQHIAFYKFTPLENLADLKANFLQICKNLQLKGTILISAEGINAALAGEQQQINQAKNYFQNFFTKLFFKENSLTTIPFKKLSVKIKKEIVPLGTEVDHKPANHKTITPLQLKKWFDEKKDFILLDTRNDYEYSIGSFTNAHTLSLKHFRKFSDALQKLPEAWKQKPVVGFCTGGIRCEKAAPLFNQAGFQEFYQLEGGILHYFEKCAGEHYQGDCFVFDDRIAVNANLQSTGATLCPHCQFPMYQHCPNCQKL